MEDESSRPSPPAESRAADDCWTFGRMEWFPPSLRPSTGTTSMGGSRLVQEDQGRSCFHPAERKQTDLLTKDGAGGRKATLTEGVGPGGSLRFGHVTSLATQAHVGGR